jgi:uncharacterized protein YodC (DUF2158 family)
MAVAIPIKTGYIAKLKSDGPWMTITDDRPKQGPKFVQASWFNGASLCAEYFPKDALELHPSVIAAAEAAVAAREASKQEG